MKTYHIRTYGCQQNIRDSEIIESILFHLGFQFEETWREADLLILNSCSVRQASEDKVFGLGREIARIREKNSDFKVIVTGCIVGSAKGLRQRFTYKSIKRRLGYADAIIANEEMGSLATLLYNWNLIPEVKSIDPNFLPESSRHGYVNISEGCDNFCSYCVVPYARGEEISRDEREILDEVQHLVSSGMTKITLLGQNVNSWGLSKDNKFKIRRSYVLQRR